MVHRDTTTSNHFWQMTRTEFLQIRLTPEDSRHLSRVAEADHLDESTWSRRAILRALAAWEGEQKPTDPTDDAEEAG